MKGDGPVCLACPRCLHLVMGRPRKKLNGGWTTSSNAARQALRLHMLTHGVYGRKLSLLADEALAHPVEVWR